MPYDQIVKVITDVCFHVGTPLSPHCMTKLLGDVIDEHIVEALCLRMEDEGLLVEFGENAYTLPPLWRHCHINLLVSREYRELGMTILSLGNERYVRYIPPKAEHHFFELHVSTIGAHAGIGLFVRSSRSIPEGCVLCEYRGRALASMPRQVEQGTYVVHVRNTQTYVDGRSATGEHLSWATFINDGGPSSANCEMMEYARYPGRVFVIATRDIGPGEELFVLYGANYWGLSSYADLPTHKSKPASRAPSVPFSTHDYVYPCRRCGEPMVRRAASLHNEHCGDPAVLRRLEHLSCVPHNEYTLVPVPPRLRADERPRAFRRAKSLVDLSNPQTFAHTLEDIVCDLEFSLKEDEEVASAQPSQH